jgi:hypothetical protein
LLKKLGFWPTICPAPYTNGNGFVNGKTMNGKATHSIEHLLGGENGIKLDCKNEELKGEECCRQKIQQQEIVDVKSA